MIADMRNDPHTQPPRNTSDLPDTRTDGRILTLAIAPHTVCFLLERLREYDALSMTPESTDGAAPLDEEDIDALRERENRFKDNPLYQELATFIGDLSVDQKVDLVALMWLGRGGLSASDWPELHAEAEEAHNARTFSYILGTPLAADYLEEGLAALGFSCGASEEQRL